MPRTILVGLDGSLYSTAAIELGIRWAKKYDAMLVGLGIIDEPTICKLEPVPIGGSAFKEQRDAALVVDARGKVTQLLEQFAIQCAEAGVSCKRIEDVGLPAERICLEAQSYDLILLGKQTYYHFETQDHADETLTKVLKSSPRPVVTVPERLGDGDCVVIAYDGSLQAARTLQAFQGLQLAQAQEVHVLAVDADHGEAVRHAERAVAFLGYHAIQAQLHAITSSSPASTIIEHTHRLGAGLLVMGAYGRPAFREFLFGSTTQSLLSETKVPLFLYH